MKGAAAGESTVQARRTSDDQPSPSGAQSVNDDWQSQVPPVCTRTMFTYSTDSLILFHPLVS